MPMVKDEFLPSLWTWLRDPTNESVYHTLATCAAVSGGDAEALTDRGERLQCFECAASMRWLAG